MKPKGTSDFFQHLDKLGEDEVREKLAQNLYGPKKRPLVEEWLRRKNADSEKRTDRIRSLRLDEEIEISRKSLRISRINTAVVSISIIISLIALVFSFLTYYQAQTEQIIVRSNRLMADYPTRLIEKPGSLIPALIDAYWECIISNIGEKTVSIIDAKVWLAENGGRTTYGQLFGGMVDTSGRSVKLPIAIEPGYSQKIIFLLRPPLSKKTYQLLIKKYPTKKVPSLQDAYKYLASNYIDFFSNPASPSYYKNNKDVVGFQINSMEKQPLFLFKFTTSQGKVLVSASGWYSFPQY